MKKGILMLSLAFVLCLGACGNNETVKESEIEIVENEVYSAPTKPTDAQVELFNELSEAINDNSDNETIANLVAQNFAFDFFSLKNKESAQDVGGLTYLPEAIRDDFKSYAMAMVYSNYATISNDMGASELPMVNEVVVDNTTATTYDYRQTVAADAASGIVSSVEENTYDAWVIDVTISYDDTKVSSDELKTVASITVFNLDGRLCVASVQ